MSKNKYYAVVKGRRTGIFTEWFGPEGAEAQVKGLAGAVFKGFATRAEAERWFASRSAGGGNPAPVVRPPGGAPEGVAPVNPARPNIARPASGSPSPETQTALQDGKVVIFTDGACTGNPGPGGYGALLLHGSTRKELSGGYRRTTNNRMELMACIAALEALKQPSRVLLYSDSKYVVDAITKGWARRWKQKGWMRNKTDPAINPDLWARLLDLLDRHDVQVGWVRGHAGQAENERCDQLSVAAAHQRDLPVDEGYEKKLSADF